MEAEYTGGSVSYYAIKVERPTNQKAAPYTAECNDIIEALGMNYAEGNAFKAIWRRCAARLGKSKKGYTDGLYDAEKVVFFGQRLVAQEKAGYAANGAGLIGVAAHPYEDAMLSEIPGAVTEVYNYQGPASIQIEVSAPDYPPAPDMVQPDLKTYCGAIDQEVLRRSRLLDDGIPTNAEITIEITVNS